MHGHTINYAGVVVEVREITTRTNKPMAFVQMEDLQGSVEITVLPKIFKSTRHLWVPDKLLFVRAKVEVRDQRLSLLCESVQENLTSYQVEEGTDEVFSSPLNGLDVAEEGEYLHESVATDERTMPPAPRQRTVHVRVRRSGQHDLDMQQLLEVCRRLQAYQGRDRCVIHVTDTSRDVVLEFPNMGTAYCPQLERDLRSLNAVLSTWLSMDPLI